MSLCIIAAGIIAMLLAVLALIILLAVVLPLFCGQGDFDNGDRRP